MVDTATALRLEADISSYRHAGRKESLFRPLRFSACGSQITCVLGASGTGKTTLLRLLVAQAPGAVAGSVAYQVDDDELEPRAAAKRGLIGVLFQGDSLIPWKRIRGNLMLPSDVNESLTAPDDPSISELFRTLALENSVLSQYPHELSLGMRQRVQFTRLLLYSPRFILIDEPFLGLDPLNTERLANALRDYVSRSGACCVMVTHDLAVASRTADRFFYLSQSGQLSSLEQQASEHALLGAFEGDSL